MNIRKSLENALHDAMRQKDTLTMNAIRSVIAAIKLAEVETGSPLDDVAVSGIIQKEIKSRRESIADAEKAGRSDLVNLAKQDIAVLEQFLPQQLSETELEELTRQTIQEVGATSISDMGKVMKALLPKVQGRSPGDKVSQMVKRLLTG
ncbi:uncharacterized conserved protein [Anaerolinea thermolimosa]|uniref:GatB/YqeY domain-containing protein n=1 Tax=Anaerolinea thermolimosa TaxID=229919 RepID=UPI000782FD31|nr:GatB/YqeY domain-containing protein [Anaerolinea thermolimosa]GAP06486.1 uncharacterized conserved protein [Anaerolinea thermolimosa]